jgi:hypothetical protein
MRRGIRPSRSVPLLLLLLSLVAVQRSVSQRGECQILAFVPFSDEYVTACDLAFLLGISRLLSLGCG